MVNPSVSSGRARADLTAVERQQLDGSSAVFTAGRENGRKRPKGYADWRPQKKTLLLLEDVRTVLDEYHDHLPLTVRQIFYRLVGRYGFEKTERGYARLAEMLVRARRARLVSFELIRDDGVLAAGLDCYAGVENFADETGRRIRNYRRDRQAGQKQYIELWCEAQGMLHQLARVANRYSIPVYTRGGFNSTTINHAVARRAVARNVPTTVLQVGDFDPSGESIFEAMTADAAAFARDDRPIQTLEIVAERVALTAEQVREYSLPTAPPKASDSRSRAWVGETCQLEALAPDELAELITSAIESKLDKDAYYLQVEQEHLDRTALLALPRGGDR